jgi:hypothetical protein
MKWKTGFKVCLSKRNLQRYGAGGGTAVGMVERYFHFYGWGCTSSIQYPKP